MKATSIELYQIVGFDMERYIELYRYAIGEKDVVEVEPFVPMADFRLRTGNISQEDYERLKADEEARMVGKTVHCKQKRGVMVSTDKITAKCQYLQDAIIRRAFAQKDTMSFSLSSAILKTVLGHEYKSILETLATMGYLRRGSDMKTDEVRKDKHFSIGDHSTMYTLLCDAVETIECSNVSIIKLKSTLYQLADRFVLVLRFLAYFAAPARSLSARPPSRRVGVSTARLSAASLPNTTTLPFVRVTPV